MPELGTSGSVRGDASNGIPYRDKAGKHVAPSLSVTSLQRLPGGLVELEALAEPLPLANRGRAAGSRYWLGKERGGQDSLSHSGACSIRAAAA
jgi:hypothetical protein